MDISNKKRVFQFVAIGLACFLAGILSISISGKAISKPDQFLLASTTNNVSIPGIQNSDTIADIVEKVGGAVVNIDVEKMERQHVFNPFRGFGRDFGFGFEIDPNFKQHFEDRLVPIKGSGSGFIIDNKGHILTNAHVIKGADAIKITLRDGKSFDAKVIGIDSNLDFAVLKFNADKFSSMALGDSDKTRPGEWVIAIGNPYGFSNTVTAGIISAKGRSLDNIGKEDLIQTDTPINPGSSGGPLINLQGEVIGINVAISPGAQGIGFAIPINSAKAVLNELITKGKIVRPWLGIYMRDVDEKTAKFMNLPLPEGVVIIEVVKGSPAEKSGFKEYDVIKEVNGKKTKNASEISSLIKEKKPGDKISFKVYREEKIWPITVKLGEMPAR